jgi:hypothetical protein
VVNCDELEDLAGALALGAALPDEVEEARKHLASCANAHAALRELMATAALLAEAPEPVEPPPRLRERILAAAHADLAAPPAAVSRPASAGVALPRPVVAPSAPAAPIARDQARFARRWPAAPWLAAAALLLLAVGFGGWSLRLRADLDDRDRQLAAQNALLAQQAQQSATRQRALDAVAQGGQVTRFAVQAQQLAGARGFVVQPYQGPSVVVLEGMQPPPDGKVYQLWSIQGGQARGYDAFRPADDGSYAAEIPDAGSADLLAITVEAHKATQPSLPPVLTARFHEARLPAFVSVSPRDGG